MFRRTKRPLRLKKRTLTNLYNERPTWLAHAHRDLDRAVVAAFGWPETLGDRAQPQNPDAADRAAVEDEILRRLFGLNQERAAAGRYARLRIAQDQPLQTPRAEDRPALCLKCARGFQRTLDQPFDGGGRRARVQTQITLPCADAALADGAAAFI